MPLSPNQFNIFAALRSFLLTATPGIEVIDAQDNRVPEPGGADFIVMTPLRQRRLSTNIDAYADCNFTASIAGSLMTVTAVKFGAIVLPAQVFTVNGTITATAQLTGTPGGIGTYQLSGTMTLASSPKCAAGIETFRQPTEWTVQLDVHGPNSGDNAETIATLFRDDFAVQNFATSGFDVTPFYADDPRQIPFINDQQQYESRWVIEAVMQANQVVSAPLQFADTFTLNIVEIPDGS